MAQEQLVLRRIDWHEVFAFTRLFNGFRLAYHSTKLILALSGLILMFTAGCLLDWVWVKSDRGVWRDEVRGYYAAANSGAFRNWAGPEYRIQLSLAAQPINPAITPTWIREHGVDTVYQDVRDRLATRGTTPEVRQANAVVMQRLAPLRPVGPFVGFVHYESSLIENVVLSAAQLRFMDGLNDLVMTRSQAVTSAPIGVERVGVLGSLMLMWSGVVWLLAEHWFFSLIFVPVVLAIWAIAGGAISRAAVMQIAKDETIGVREAVQFAMNKFWGFFLTPLVCLLFVVAIGLLLTVGGLIGNIPYVGDILIGVLWILALVGGLAIAFITIGTLAGGSLFSPVIASEGSDAFDALSRGFVYVYSRPWKSLLYGATLVIYGSLCYLFLRFFVWIMLLATHAFVGLGMLGSREYAGAGANKLDVVWRTPTLMDLRPHVFDYYGQGVLGGGEVLLAVLIGLWTYLVWGLLQSWLVSYYFSGSTMAYLLLRKDVDAIEMDEIYVEEEPEATPGEPVSTEATPASGPAQQPAAGPETMTPPAPQTGGESSGTV